MRRKTLVVCHVLRCSWTDDRLAHINKTTIPGWGRRTTLMSNNERRHEAGARRALEIPD